MHRLSLLLLLLLLWTAYSSSPVGQMLQQLLSLLLN
jgi:hypothetical protein